MFDRVYALPEGLILALTVLLLVGLMAAMPLLVRQLRWMTHNDLNTDFVIRTQATLFTMTSLVLTFTLVQADTNYRQAENLVTNEAARIEQLDRLMARFGDRGVAEARSLIKVYAESLIRDEWPVMLNEERHEVTARSFATLSRRVLAIDPANERQNLVLAEILKTVDTIADLRAQRLSFVSTSLPNLYWWVVVLAVAMLLFVSGAIGPTPFRRTILCAQAAVLGGFLGFVFIMDQPFRGEMAISPEPIVKAVQRMDQRRD